MNHAKGLLVSSVLVLAIVSSVAFLSGCSGDGGGGTGRLLLIEAEGSSLPLFQLVGGVPTVPAICPTGVFVNARITFTFNRAVDASSLPAAGPASGPITILDPTTGGHAIGTFTVEDDPALPSGNNRRVVFRPTLPSDPNATCAAGIVQAQVYEISVPSGPSSSLVLTLQGDRLDSGGETCFKACGCPDGGGCVTPFIDAVAGPPVVLDTLPATSDPAPGAIDPCTIAGNTIEIRISEPLDPATANLTNVRVVNVASGAQVPGSLVFHQAINMTGGDLTSQIDYVASGPLVGSRTYEVILGPGLTDLSGNSIQQPAQLFFQTLAVLATPQPPLVENFDAAGATSGAAAWSGDGFLRGVFPVELTGTGAEGDFNPLPGVTTLLDTNQMVGGASRQGVWNYQNVNIPPSSTVRIIGPYFAHIRCTGSFTLNGTIAAIPGQQSPPGPGTVPYDRGPEQGKPDNGGFPLNCEANGGVGNAGGGNGGTASGITPPAGSPSNFQCTIRAEFGESGFGPRIDGAVNTGIPPNASYAAGQGGDSGCFPAIGVGCLPGDLGGLGGAGGSAGRVGEPGVPRTTTAACTPLASVTQPVAQPSPVPVAMVPPIAFQSAGSGGGGGGDRFGGGTPPAQDSQGGGGGGAGGGLRISCVGAYSQGTGGTGLILATGGFGQTAQQSGGGGGSGSGGEIWIQSFSTVTIPATATINVDGPGRFQPTIGLVGCSSQAAGGGGDGLVQIEAGMGPPPTSSFNLLPTPTPTNGAVFSAPPFAYSGTISGFASSGLQYVGVGAPDYMTPVEVVSLGDAPGATVTITYRGAQEAVNSTPLNPIFDPATIKSTATGGGPITAANIDELDGYPFLEWSVTIAFPPPPTTTLASVLPSVDSITIPFSAAVCP